MHGVIPAKAGISFAWNDVAGWGGYGATPAWFGALGLDPRVAPHHEGYWRILRGEFGEAVSGG